jgi:hypothetical protein
VSTKPLARELVSENNAAMAHRKKAAREHEEHPATAAEEGADTSAGSVDKIVFVVVIAIAASVFALSPARGSAGDHGHARGGDKPAGAAARPLEPPPAQGELDEDEEGEAEFEIVEEEEELPEGDPLLAPDDDEPELELEPGAPPPSPPQLEAPPPPTAAPEPVAPPPPAAPRAPKPKPKPAAAPKPPSGDNPY